MWGAVFFHWRWACLQRTSFRLSRLSLLSESLQTWRSTSDWNPCFILALLLFSLDNHLFCSHEMLVLLGLHSFWGILFLQFTFQFGIILAYLFFFFLSLVLHVVKIKVRPDGWLEWWRFTCLSLRRNRDSTMLFTSFLGVPWWEGHFILINWSWRMKCKSRGALGWAKLRLRVQFIHQLINLIKVFLELLAFFLKLEIFLEVILLQFH